MGEHWICAGCQPDVALKCLEDFRGNVSGNLHPACSQTLKHDCGGAVDGEMQCSAVRKNAITVLSDHKLESCCARCTDNNDAQTIVRGTAGYPDVLLCLEYAGCKDSPL